MKILFLGGTRFVGRHTVQEALSRGHRVDLFHRGQTGADLFQGQANHILGDRDSSLQELENDDWDAVIDFCGYRPTQVRRSCSSLKSRARQYLFISTLSVYDPGSEVATEGTSVLQLPYGRTEDEELDNETYGPLKALCEEEVRAAFGNRAAVFRIGLQVGPYDQADRFGNWIERIATRKEVVVPIEAHQPWQFIDARDTARFIVETLESGAGGIFNVTGEQTPRSDVLEDFKAALNPTCQFIDVDPAKVIESGLDQRQLMALSLRSRNRDGHLIASIKRAQAAGLKHRPMPDTIRDTWEWIQTLPEDRDREAGLPKNIEDKLLSSF